MMPRESKVLTPEFVRKVTEQKRHRDGDGLFLHVREDGSKNWLYCYTIAGRSRSMGLGVWPNVSLKEAREKADAARKLKEDGIDPLETRKTAQREQRFENDRRLSYAKACEKFLEERSKSFKNRDGNDKQKKEWTRTLGLFASTFRDVSVAQITLDMVRTALLVDDLWMVKHPTAKTAAINLGALIDWCVQHNYRDEGDNPSNYRRLLKRMPKVEHVTQNRASFGWEPMPEFMRELRARDGMPARAVELVALSGARVDNVCKARWQEFDLTVAKWTIPADNMKKAGEHEVPLSKEVVAMLKSLPSYNGGAPEAEGFVFPAPRGGQYFPDRLNDELRALGYPAEQLVMHGLRTSLRTWVIEHTSTSTEVADACIAQDRRPAKQRAYERTRFYDLRTPLMQAYSDFVYHTGEDGVLPFKAAA